MFSNSYAELLMGLALFATAFIIARGLISLARRRPRSLLVNESVIADMVCVGEVVLIVGGIMMLSHGLMTLV